MWFAWPSSLSLSICFSEDSDQVWERCPSWCCCSRSMAHFGLENWWVRHFQVLQGPGSDRGEILPAWGWPALSCCVAGSLTGGRGLLNVLCSCWKYALGQHLRFFWSGVFFPKLLPSWDWGNVNSLVSVALHLCSIPTKSKVRCLGILSSFPPAAPLVMHVLCESSCLQALGISFDFCWKITVFPSRFFHSSLLRQ